MTWLFLPQFICLFCSLFCFVLSTYMQPFISCAPPSLIDTYSPQTNCKMETKRERETERGNMSSLMDRFLFFLREGNGRVHPTPGNVLVNQNKIFKTWEVQNSESSRLCMLKKGRSRKNEMLLQHNFCMVYCSIYNFIKTISLHLVSD